MSLSDYLIQIFTNRRWIVLFLNLNHNRTILIVFSDKILYFVPLFSNIFLIEVVLSLQFSQTHHLAFLTCFPNVSFGMWFNYGILNNFLKEWTLRKEELKSGKITRDEYFEWKINWPQTCDDCGKREPSKQWRCSNE